VIADAHPKGRRHRIGGNVIMGWTDAPGCKDKIIPGPKRVQGRDDLGFHIAHHARFFQVYPARAQKTGDIIDVGVLGAAGQDLVADHQDGGGPAFAVFGRAFIHGKKGV